MSNNTPTNATHIPGDLSRVIVVGSSGSGKTTLARGISQALGSPHIELDAIRHGPNWTETPDDIFREKVGDATQEDIWVVDGNYSIARDVLWPKATTLIYLDYSVGVIMRRLIARTLRRNIKREVLWNGNKENILDNFKIFSNESVIAYSLKNHWRRRQDFTRLFEHPDYAHVQKLRFRTPRATEEWLKGLASQNGHR
ncbi:MAG: adenylate kinase [SAR202 cluster bacterium]|jgi:adenylate kinase family enzyme|nr:adenylate kinase [SAR202 cluster bacterium]|tara:strand:- start:2170 stop:2763 length:594 start_codon:yes stop_codon:yes gene_type:complete